MDLSILFELRKAKADLERKVEAQSTELREMESHMRDLQIQLLVIIHSMKGHSITLSPDDYDNLPDSVSSIQEEHPDGSYTITVSESPKGEANADTTH